MNCRTGCGACCIAPSITSSIPGKPEGKPAGMRCIHLTPEYRCALYGKPERPAVCNNLRPALHICGNDREQALALLMWLELATRPD